MASEVPSAGIEARAGEQLLLRLFVYASIGVVVAAALWWGYWTLLVCRLITGHLSIWT